MKLTLMPRAGQRSHSEAGETSMNPIYCRTCANLERRFIAFFIDSFIVIFLGLGVLKVLTAVMTHAKMPGVNPWTIICIINIVAFWVVSFLYFAVFESSVWQATPGKKLLGLAVNGVEGKRLSAVQGGWRFLMLLLPYLLVTWAGYYYPSLSAGLGALILSWIIIIANCVPAEFNCRKQCLHDIVSKSIVVIKPPNSNINFKVIPDNTKPMGAKE